MMMMIWGCDNLQFPVETDKDLCFTCVSRECTLERRDSSDNLLTSINMRLADNCIAAFRVVVGGRSVDRGLVHGSPIQAARRHFIMLPTPQPYRIHNCRDDGCASCPSRSRCGDVVVFYYRTLLWDDSVLKKEVNECVGFNVPLNT